ncbi:hypothetical protein DFR65_1121 [Oceanihabitans sediminis]|uniref:Uncharacterized protein n=1 Tax=Oceanihabitans sediminis TaxID=1812012 RepID=A0A368P0K3_9FLAO|nr:hypothetical protein [Oceanihabitans sediminis]RBP27023.1 hypothetical protein DFR65_1121 [Oceanihabitans sediminis]RCU56377.1 hypothetical protein DU428_13020 [Oceanihabitans sediminis]
MKNLLLIILTLNFGLTFSQNIELIESRNFDGAIFPKTYDIPLTENPPIEKRFTPTKEEIVELEKQLRGQIKEINKNKPNQGKHYGPIIHKRLKKYDRQYIGFIDQYGQRVIHVNFIWNGYSIWELIRGWTKPDDSWKTEWQMWFDGGSRFWNINYIMDKKEFVDFSVNGVA